jgi:hypothetical protein
LLAPFSLSFALSLIFCSAVSSSKAEATIERKHLC